MTQVLLLLAVTFCILNSNSFWSLWINLELYSFVLMPWLLEGEDKASKTHVFFYFLMQFLASITFLTSSLSNLNKISITFLFCSLLMKLSCFPFHSWFINVIPYISWKKILILVSLSKLSPVAIMLYLTPPKGFMWLIILGLVLTLGGFSTTCLRSVMAYSSVAHSSWLVVSTYMSKTLSLYYMLVYLSISLPLCVVLMMESLTNMKSALVSKKSRASLLLTVLTLSGIPPFLGFIPKFMATQMLVQSGAMTEAVILGILSVLPVYFYFKTGVLSLSSKAWSEFVFSSPLAFILIFTNVSSVVALIYFMLSLSLSLLKH